MTYDEAVAEVARLRGCKPEELAVCSQIGVAVCGLDPCNAVRELMATTDLAAPGAATEQPTDPFEAASPVQEKQSSNPKTLMGNLKVRNLSVIPFTALIHEARAMEYGAFNAPRRDGSKGYGPFNWRDTQIEYLTYAEAAIRHIASAVDREDTDPDTGDLKVLHLALARATLGILIDAIEHKTVIDDRSPTACGRVAALLRELRKPIP